MDCCLEIPGYFTSQRQAEHLRRLRREFPFVYIHELTRTAYGRPIHALQIGSGDRKILLTAGHHANETITSEVLWRFLFTYCKALRAERTVCGADALSLYHEAMVYLVPLVNPDGADLAAGAIAPGSAEYCAAAQIAAVFPDVPFPSGWKANLSGVDLNLNYPARWEAARRIKKAQGVSTPAPRDFAGFSPLDQPETAALAAFTRCIHPDMMLALHTQGSVIYPGPDETAPPGSHALARAFSEASGYPIEPVPPESANAGFKDWFLQVFKRPAFTIEAGLGENPLPASQLPEITRAFSAIFTAAMQW